MEPLLITTNYKVCQSVCLWIFNKFVYIAIGIFIDDFDLFPLNKFCLKSGAWILSLFFHRQAQIFIEKFLQTPGQVDGIDSLRLSNYFTLVNCVS